MSKRINTKVSYASASNDLCFVDLPMSEFNILLTVIRNSEDGTTFVEHPTMNAKYKMKTVMFIDQKDNEKIRFVWDAKNMGFFNGMEPGFFLKIKLRFFLFFGI